MVTTCSIGDVTMIVGNSLQGAEVVMVITVGEPTRWKDTAPVVESKVQAILHQEKGYVKTGEEGWGYVKPGEEGWGYVKPGEEGWGNVKPGEEVWGKAWGRGLRLCKAWGRGLGLCKAWGKGLG